MNTSAYHRGAAPGAVGLVLARPARLLSVEPFFMEFIGGIEERLAERDVSVLLHIVADQQAELAAYRRWAAKGLVDAVAVVNPVVGDERPGVLAQLGLPAVLVGTWEGGTEGGTAASVVGTDNAAPVHEALRHLLDLGHRRVARVSGPAELLHTGKRTAALQEGCRAAGIEPPVIVEGDYSREAGADLTAALLRRPDAPTAVLYDNDVMAVAGLQAAKELGVAVPEQVSLIAWDDSTLCQLAAPPLTAMSVDVHRFGAAVGESVLEAVDGLPVARRSSPGARITPRGSTAPPPVRGASH
ncbi:substrate-binding domain-containing protein [Streptomonospora sediminis]